MGWDMRFSQGILQFYNLTNLSMAWDVRFSQAIFQSYNLTNLPMGWDVRFPQGILQSYNLTNFPMGCKFLPGNLTILQTSPWDVRFSQGILQSYKVLQCLQFCIISYKLWIYKFLRTSIFRFGDCLMFWEPRFSDLVNVLGFGNLNFQIRWMF